MGFHANTDAEGVTRATAGGVCWRGVLGHAKLVNVGNTPCGFRLLSLQRFLPLLGLALLFRLGALLKEDNASR